MSDQNTTYIGKKFACPGCRSNLKFRRPPKSLLYTCPSCRKKLRLQDEAAAAAKDEMVKMAIESLVNSREAIEKPYDYTRDPKLDTVENPQPGVWLFEQPWPKSVDEIVVENAEVICHPMDEDRAMGSRKIFLEGKFRRVTVFRTGQVEQMQVSGHWWDFEPRESKLGLLSRSIVRQINKHPLAKQFAARVNHVNRLIRDHKERFEFYVDIAIDRPEELKNKTGANFK